MVTQDNRLLFTCDGARNGVPQTIVFTDYASAGRTAAADGAAAEKEQYTVWIPTETKAPEENRQSSF